MSKNRLLPIVVAVVLALVMGTLWRGTAHAQVVCDTATQFVWDGGGATDVWQDPLNWDNDVSPDTVPGEGIVAGVDVCIGDQNPDITVLHPIGGHLIGSLDSDEAVHLSGGTLSIGSASQINSTFTQSGASTFTGAGDLAVSGLFTWSRGSHTGSGTTTANAGISLDTNQAKTLGRTLINPGGQTTTWLDGSFSFTTGAVFNNLGTFNAEHDDDHTISGGATRTFNNIGEFNKSVGAGITTIGVRLNNTGQVNAQIGTLALNFLTQTAGSTLLDGGSITNSTPLGIEGGVLEGGGSITGNISVTTTGQLAPGTSTDIINSIGNYTQSSTGIFAVEIDGLLAGTQFDQYNLSPSNIANGIATLAGTLDITKAAAFDPPVGTEFTIMTFDSRVGTFGTVITPEFNNKHFVPIYNPANVVLRVQLVPGVQPQLTVIKTVINDNGGTAVASDFTMDVIGTNPSLASFPGDAAGTTITLDAGPYSVTETGPAGYTPSQSANCNGVIAAGQSLTCTFTNDDIPPAMLTVIKTVINDDGGTAVASDFTMDVIGTNPSLASFPGDAAGTTITLDAGPFSVTETGPAGYTPSQSANCNGVIAAGQSLTCTFTNDDIPPALLTVIKTVINDDGGTAVASDFTMDVIGTNPSLASFPGNAAGTTITLEAGPFSVTETGPAGYTASQSANCNGVIAAGQSLTCTFTNDDIPPALLTVIKTVINDNGGGE